MSANNWNILLQSANRANEPETVETTTSWCQAVNYVAENMLQPDYILTSVDILALHAIFFPDEVKPRENSFSLICNSPVPSQPNGLRCHGESVCSWEEESQDRLMKFFTPQRKLAVLINTGQYRPSRTEIEQLLYLEELDRIQAGRSGSWRWSNDTELLAKYKRLIISSMYIGSYIAPSFEKLTDLFEDFIANINKWRLITKDTQDKNVIVRIAAYIFLEGCRCHFVVKGNGRLLRLLMNWWLHIHDLPLLTDNLLEFSNITDLCLCTKVIQDMPLILVAEEKTYFDRHNKINWDGSEEGIWWQEGYQWLLTKLIN